MSHFLKKVIQASAGTGKTYRLSLEYIGLLLRCRGEGIHFSEILVITFTKKATAEIRERIFSQMKALIDDPSEAQLLRDNLQELLGHEWQAGDQAYLRKVHQEMLTNKSQLQISTIDAFINRLFKSIISPFIGLSSYVINSEMDPRYFADLYSHALQPGNLEIIKELFKRSQKRTLLDYETLVKNLLEQRWLFHFIGSYGRSHHPSPQAAAAHLAEFVRLFDGILGQFSAYLQEDKPDLNAREALLAKWYELFFDPADAPGQDWLARMRVKLADGEFLRANHKLLLKDLKFWHGGKVMGKKIYKELADDLKGKLDLAKGELADFLYHSDFLVEENELMEVARMLLQKYDELRFRDQVFGYSDIAYYTFKYLYDPELSLVEEDSVTNSFYEILASRVRFLLIDEFQDTSLLQFKILWPMIREVISGEGVRDYGGVIVVGDEKQSIYGWRGGERDLLLAIPDLLGNAETIRLGTSYRSSPVIIDFVNDFFGAPQLQQGLASQKMIWPYVPCQAARKELPGGIFVCFRSYSDDDEGGDLASLRDACDDLVRKEILPLLQQGAIRPGETAILARANRDLRAIADIFDELKIDYVLESSNSVLEHRAIKPAIFLLRYLATQDFEEALKFLRSDYLLVGGRELKQILLAYRDATADASPQPLWHKLAGRLPDSAAVQRCSGFFESAAALDLLTFCKTIFESFAVTRLFAQENDSKNITFFLQLVAFFCHNQREFPPTPAGFVRYCELHAGDENWQQLGLEEVDAIRLLTVHKSKGLEFGNVFLFWPVDTGGSDRGGLGRYVQYDPLFHHIEEYALSYNYGNVLAESGLKQLVEQEEAKGCIEELNAFYVAVTRAKHHLGIYMPGKHKEGVEGLLAKAAGAEKMTADWLILTTLHELLAGQKRLLQPQSNAASARWGKWDRADASRPALAGTELDALADYLDPERGRWYHLDKERLSKERFLDYKSVYVNKRSVDRGNVVHYYLSFIDFDSPAARQRAARRTLSDFGSLLPAAEVNKLIEKVERFLDDQTGYFSAAEWLRVFTEQTLFDPDGHEQRIDRMLLSEERKEILIIDFKTGESHEQAQLDDYIRTIASLPHVRSRGYAVRGLFLEVNIE